MLERMAKSRHKSPKCEGRFSELRTALFQVADDVKDFEEDPLWSVRNRRGLEKFREIMEAGDYLPPSQYDRRDPYFGNMRDTLRGDPLVGNQANHALSLAPLIFEALRSSLKMDVERARSMVQEIDVGTLELELGILEASEITRANLDLLSRLNAGELRDILGMIAERDWTITANSVETAVIDDYAQLYVTHPKLLDALRLFHKGVYRLDKELGIDMANVVLPRTVPLPNDHKDRKNGTHLCDLKGYVLRAEFGPGMNTEGTLVASAPYRIEVYKEDREASGHGNYIPVFGMSFFIRHPDIMVVAQIQDIRGARVPECTTLGLAALTIAERLGRVMGFKQIETYSRHNHPLLLLYPGDEERMHPIIKMNFEEPAHILKWEPLQEREKGPILGYRKRL